MNQYRRSRLAYYQLSPVAALKRGVKLPITDCAIDFLVSRLIFKTKRGHDCGLTELVHAICGCSNSGIKVRSNDHPFLLPSFRTTLHINHSTVVSNLSTTPPNSSPLACKLWQWRQDQKFGAHEATINTFHRVRCYNLLHKLNRNLCNLFSFGGLTTIDLGIQSFVTYATPRPPRDGTSSCASGSLGVPQGITEQCVFEVWFMTTSSWHMIRTPQVELASPT